MRAPPSSPKDALDQKVVADALNIVEGLLTGTHRLVILSEPLAFQEGHKHTFKVEPVDGK